MLEDRMDQGLFPFHELSHLRLEAMQLFEHCLTQGDETPLVTFIERQLVQEPPRLQLLQDVADDLQQRLLSLREYHFDVRERVVRTLQESYAVDITPLSPPSALASYHMVAAERVLSFIREMNPALDEKDIVLLHKMIEASLQMARQLHNDIELTLKLHRLVLDWLEGINATFARQYWSYNPNRQEHHRH
jgi:hypothetical protein